MYMIADLQIAGRYFADGTLFDTKEAVKEQLISYHSVDMGSKTDLHILKKMSLDELLEFGGWELEETDPSCNDCKKCGENTCGGDVGNMQCFEPI